MMIGPKQAAQLWRLQIDTAQMMAQANMVIALRMMGMAGTWPVPAREAQRMVAEKGPALAAAGMAAGWAALAGAAPAAVAAAWLRPVGRKTRANARRLTRPAR